MQICLTYSTRGADATSRKGQEVSTSAATIPCPTKRGRSSRAAVERSRHKETKASSGSDSDGRGSTPKRARHVLSKQPQTSLQREIGHMLLRGVSPTHEEPNEGPCVYQKHNQINLDTCGSSGCHRDKDSYSICTKALPKNKEIESSEYPDGQKVGRNPSEHGSVQARNNSTRCEPDCQEHKNGVERKLHTVLPRPGELNSSTQSLGESTAILEGQPGNHADAAASKHRMPSSLDAPWPWPSWLFWDSDPSHPAQCLTISTKERRNIETPEHEMPAPAFNPLFYLQLLFTPQQVAQMQAQNPGMYIPLAALCSAFSR